MNQLGIAVWLEARYCLSRSRGDHVMTRAQFLDWARRAAMNVMFDRLMRSS